MSSVKIDLIEKKNELVKQEVGNELVEQGAVGRGQGAGGKGKSKLLQLKKNNKTQKEQASFRVES